MYKYDALLQSKVLHYQPNILFQQDFLEVQLVLTTLHTVR